MQIKQIITFLIVLILILPGFAHAHKVIIFAWVENGMIISESHFGSKRKAMNCNINVINEKGQVVHKGRTDENGIYSFKIPENIDSDLVLNLDAGAGHKAHWKISKSELGSNLSNNDLKNVNDIKNTNNITNVMEVRAKLKQNPSVYKIIAGIAIIFFLAFALKFIKKKAYKNYD
jgi:nickel transport protein